MKNKEKYNIPDIKTLNDMLETQQNIINKTLRRMDKIGNQWAEENRIYKNGEWVTIQTKGYTTIGTAKGGHSIVTVPPKYRQAEVYGVTYDRLKKKIIYKLRPINEKGRVFKSKDDYLNPNFDKIIGVRPNGDFCEQFYKNKI